jgi:hypothetical protein
MIYKVETKAGFIEYEFADQQSAKDYVMAFLSWSGTKYRIVKARQTVPTANLISTKDIYADAKECY